MLSLDYPILRFQKDDFLITTDPAEFELEVVYNFLAHSYWAENIPYETVARSVRNALCYAVFHDNKQVGFARVITDFATFGYLADVFIVEAYRGKGLSKWLMDCILNQTPIIQTFRSMLLKTADAHGLYAQYGFTPLSRVERVMEKVNFTKY